MGALGRSTATAGFLAFGGLVGRSFGNGSRQGVLANGLQSPAGVPPWKPAKAVDGSATAAASETAMRPRLQRPRRDESALLTSMPSLLPAERYLADSWRGPCDAFRRETYSIHGACGWPTDQGPGPRSGALAVASRPAEQAVVATAATQDVPAAVAADQVVAAAAVDLIVSALADDDVLARGADHVVVAARADDVGTPAVASRSGCGG